MILRGQLVRLDEYWLVVVSTNSLADMLPTSWVLLVTSTPGPLGHPLQLVLPAGEAGEHPDLWIRTTQIRTVATSQLEPVGMLPNPILNQLDRILPRLIGNTSSSSSKPRRHS